MVEHEVKSARVWRLPVAALVLFAGGCLDLLPYQGLQCEPGVPGHGCLDGRVCRAGFCADPSEVPDTGVFPDGGADAGDGGFAPDGATSDGGPVTDGGSSLLPFTETFEQFPVGVWGPKSSHGRWVVTASAGVASLVMEGGSKVLSLVPDGGFVPGQDVFVHSVADAGLFEDFDLSVKLKPSFAGFGRVDVRWRIVDAQHYHYAGFFVQTLPLMEVGRADGTSRDVLKTTLGTAQSGILRVRHVGKLVTVWYNGTELISESDPLSYPRGGVGFGAMGAEVTFDDLQIVAP